MVSCDTYIASSSGYFLLSQPEICSGDQSALSFSATKSRRRSFTESRHLLGRRALCQAFSSALVARYLLRPPLRFTSLQTVEADRPSRVAIARRDSPVASPREISSRSAGVSAHPRLRRSGGEKPPVASIIPWMEPGAFCRARAMSRMDSPALHRSHNSFLPAADNPPGRPSLATPAPPIRTTHKTYPVLHRPVEPTKASRRKVSYGDARWGQPPEHRAGQQSAIDENYKPTC